MAVLAPEGGGLTRGRGPWESRATRRRTRRRAPTAKWSRRQPPPRPPDQRPVTCSSTSLGLTEAPLGSDPLVRLGDLAGRLAEVAQQLPLGGPAAVLRDVLLCHVVALDEAVYPLDDVRVPERGAADRAVRQRDLVVPDV